MASTSRRRGALAGIATLAVVLLAGCTGRLVTGNHNSDSPSMSDDGLIVAFASYASDLVPGDDNGKNDIFLRDLRTGALVQVTEGNGNSYFPQTSADGGFVLFFSFATDLVPGGGAGQNLFLWERATGTTTKITANSAELEASLSGDGRYVAYAGLDSPLVPGDTNEMTDVLVWDRLTGVTSRITDGQPDGDFGGPSWLPSISADGGRIAFTSEAKGLIPGDTRTGRNVFVWDRASGVTTRITGFGAGFSQSPEISADGQHVVFYSTELLAPGDAAPGTDMHVWNRVPGTITLLPANTELIAGDPAISNDGRFVVYRSGNSLLRWDRNTGTSTVLVTGNSLFSRPDVTADGQVVVVASYATDLVPGVDPNGTHSDLFMWAATPS